MRDLVNKVISSEEEDSDSNNNNEEYGSAEEYSVSKYSCNNNNISDLEDQLQIPQFIILEEHPNLNVIRILFMLQMLKFKMILKQ